MDELRKWGSQLRKGSLEMCLLGAIARRPSYGFEIAQTLGRGADLAVAEGTLYPLLNRLLAEGLIEASWRESSSGPPRKYYALTAAGGAALVEMRAEWQRYVAAVEQLFALPPEQADLAPPLDVGPRKG